MIKIAMTLALDLATIPADSPGRASFEQSFRTDVAVLLGIDTSRVVIDGVAAGSVVVSFRIHPDLSGASMPVADITSTFGAAGISVAGSTTTAAITPADVQVVHSSDTSSDTTASDSDNGSDVLLIVIVSLGSMVLLLGAGVCCRRRCGDDGNCMTMEVRPPAEPSKRWHSIEENTSGVERERNEP